MSGKALQQQQENLNVKNVNTEDIQLETNEKLADNILESIDVLPPEIAKKLEEVGLNEDQKLVVVEAITTAEHFSGPLPHPSILAGYEEIIPGAADRIFSMAENEANHRHSVDDRCIKIDSRDSLLGIIAAFTLGMTCIIGGIVVIIKVPQIMGTIAGIIVAGGGLAGILGTFIRGTTATWKLKNEKKEVKPKPKN